MSMPGGFHSPSEDDSDYTLDDEADMDLLEEDAELEEAERMAAAADLVAADDTAGEEEDEDLDEPNDREAIQLGVNASGDLYILSSDGSRVPLSADLINHLPGLRQLLSRSVDAEAAEEEFQEEEDESSDEDIGYLWPTRRRRRTGPRPVIFPVRKEPDPAGLRLARSGEFGRTNPALLTPPRRIHQNHSVQRQLRAREYRKVGSPSDRQNIGQHCVPNSVGSVVCNYYANPYCGKYSEDGSFYYTCGQDFKVRIYDTTEAPSSSIRKATRDSAGEPRVTESMPHLQQPSLAGSRMFRYSEDESVLKEIKTVQGRSNFSRWTITDANLSPLNDALIYSSIGPVVSFVRTKEGEHLETMSTDAQDHTQLNFAAGLRGDFGIWSIRFSSDAREIVAGASHGDIFLYDIERARSTLRIEAHYDDVNAVDFADTTSSNVLVSGSDDSLIKVWDRRSMRGQTPSGVLVGHTEGITFVASKGDGRYLVSNGKDQTCKLWDMRMMYAPQDAENLRPKNVGVPDWDYRGPLYDEPRYRKHPNDVSVCTYTGHSVLQTLIRCHFSPAATTGQQYIYSGSADGRIHIWNLDGTVHKVLDRRDVKSIRQDPYTTPKSKREAQPTSGQRGGRGTVRDVSWHPYRPELMAVSWEGRMSSHGQVQLHTWRP